MGFLDKAKAAANDLAAKADTALAGSNMGGPGAGGPPPERCFRDLGVLAYLEATGREPSAEDRERLLSALREAESRGPLNLQLQTSAQGAGGAPPPPGAAAGGPPPPPGAAASAPAPPPGPSGAPPTPAPPASAPTSESPVPPSSPPPPPPSWADDNG